MYKEEFIQYGIKYQLDKETLIDLFQDAFILFYENTLHGKVTVFNSSIKTYLFAIGKNLISNELRKKKSRTMALKTEIPYAEPEYDSKELSERQMVINKAIGDLGKTCQEVLSFFYYHQLSIKEITKKMNYNSDNVTKSKKSQCMKKLKSLVANYAIR